MDSTADATQLLQAIGRGSKSAADALLPLVYDELRSIAERYFRGQPADHTLQPTALVHEAFLRLIDRTANHWKSEAHFLAVAATAMRQILVDHARSRATAKRGGKHRTLTLDEAALPQSETPDEDLLALNDVLSQLGELDARQCRIVEMRFFGGMKVEEIAEVLGVAKTTVDNHWRAARAWLNVRLRDDTQ